MNPQTGGISPSYHVVFDDYFATVGSSPSQWPDFNSDEWYRLVRDSVYQYPTDSWDDDDRDFFSGANSEYLPSEVMNDFDPHLDSVYRPFCDDPKAMGYFLIVGAVKIYRHEYFY